MNHIVDISNLHNKRRKMHHLKLDNIMIERSHGSIAHNVFPEIIRHKEPQFLLNHVARSMYDDNTGNIQEGISNECFEMHGF